MVGIILKKEKENILNEIWDIETHLYFRPTELLVDVIGNNIKDNHTIRNIVENHDKKLERFEIDNLFFKYIENLKKDYWWNNIVFLLNEDCEIIGEALVQLCIKFKLQTYDDWDCNFCKKGDKTKIQNVIGIEEGHKFYWNKWLENLGQNDLIDCFIEKKHKCSNCQQWLNKYYVADKSLIDFMKNLKDKNYWIFSMSYVKKYENWKDFNFKKVNVLTYEKNK